ncbi:pre-mRNA processing RNA-helicase [Coemansia sp. RSA 552]|nr:pre-mRNA processing RNA-helicase [Coemansia sp. RSA 552]
MTLARWTRHSNRYPSRSGRSRSPEQRRRATRRSDADRSNGDGRRSRRSRSPPARRLDDRDGPSTSPGRLGQRDAGADGGDAAKLSVKERMALWRKRKEQEKPADASPTAESSRPNSRGSSAADGSSSSVQFVTAPGSAASEHCSQSNSAFESPLSTPAESNAPPASASGEPDRPPPEKVAAKLGTGLRPGGAKVKISLGRPGIGGKRVNLRAPSSLGRSVFGPEAGADADGGSASSLGRAAKVPSVSSPAAEDGHRPDATDNATMDIDEPEADSLEEYMRDMETKPGDANGDAVQVLGEDGGGYGSDSGPVDPEDLLAMAAKRLKKKDLPAIDHSKIEYEHFKRNFYIEPAELRSLTPEEVDMMRVDLGGIKIRGVNPPKPATSWSYFGLPAACADVIKRQGFETPTPIQAQAIPAILSGRDMIGVAKTGSGKTLAFILPMLRHIKAQRPLQQGEGPIGLVMTPTRELAVQIHRECRPFLKPLGLRAVCAYGGSAIKDQIGELKRGCEIIVCTPGRFIDLLCANSGRVTNLHRVTYLVLDEADRMFDMGFEPQVMRIVQNVRPSRQTALFSATFPRQMEALARKILRRPLEIVVGGRALIPPEVTQHVEVVEQQDKFFRLLAILGESFNRNSETLALIFVDRQEAADGLLRDLMRRGYVCNSLHGGKDQTDRDQAIVDFKNRIFSVLIATSVAARGLDVRGLNVVINFDCPNHMEDLVHRVGRTGRAGNKGDAYTFIAPDQDRYANEVVKAMKLSGLTPPEDVQQLADAFLEKVHQGKERHSKSGFGGKGLEKLDKDRSMVKKIQKISYGVGDGEAGDDESDEGHSDVDSDGNPSRPQQQQQRGKGGETVRRLDSAPSVRRQSSFTSSRPPSRPSSAAGVQGPAAPSSTTPLSPAGDNGQQAEGMSAAARAAVLAAQAAARRLNIGAAAAAQQSTQLSVVDQINKQLGGASEASAIAAALTKARGNSSTLPRAPGRDAKDSSSGPPGIPVGLYGCELDINDYPQKARWRATNRDTLSRIIEQSGAAITTRGIFVPPGRPVPEGERKLYLSIEADTERAAEQAKNEIKRILVEATVQIMENESRGGSGRYSVV